jgi:hypothetical protein
MHRLRCIGVSIQRTLRYMLWAAWATMRIMGLALRALAYILFIGLLVACERHKAPCGAITAWSDSGESALIVDPCEESPHFPVEAPAFQMERLQ